MNVMKWLGGLCAALAVLLACAGACRAETAQDITALCKVRTSEGKASRFLDEKISSSWGYERQGATVTIELPAGYTPGAMEIKWKYDPTAYLIEEFDANHEPIACRDQNCTFPGISSYYPLSENTRYLVLTITAMDQRISSLRLYSAGAPEQSVQIWEPQLQKADLMVVSTHQDDELIFFGGLIPYYDLVEGKATQVVYMADCARSRREEALKGLWIMGVRTYPEFINLLDEHIASYSDTLAHWGGEECVIGQLVERIRRFRPEVIVTHDLNGEYGHNQHKITARVMQAAIEAAADSSRFPDSAQRYGAWQTKKLYLHLYGENRLYMDWQTPCDALDGRTPLETAQLGYSMHVSQHKYYQVVAGGAYDNAAYGLSYSTVGLDTAGRNDMFEHIVHEEQAEDARVEAAETAHQAAAEATQALATDSPRPQETDSDRSSREESRPTDRAESSGRSAGWLWAVPAVAAAVLCAWLLHRRREREWKKRVARSRAHRAQSASRGARPSGPRTASPRRSASRTGRPPDRRKP